MPYRAYKTELAPNNKQATFFWRCAGISRFVYNWALSQWKFQFDAGEKPSAYKLKKQFNAIKYEQCPWVTEVPYAVTESAFENLKSAFQHFFRRVKNGEKEPGYPRFKSRKHPRQSFQLKGICQIEHDRVRLSARPEMWVRLKERWYIPTDAKYGIYATISHKAGRWYISVLVETQDEAPVNGSDLVVGVDFGLKTLAVLSTGEVFENPHCLRKAMTKLSRLQRELSRRKQGGANWRKTKLKLQRQHAKVANIRSHIQHNISHYLTATLRPHVIVLEDLNVSGMTKNHHLAQAVSDVGFYELRRQVEYKAAHYGCEVLIADRWFASSKTCSGCGWHNADLTLADRTFRCPECGLELDRDHNAALNLAKLAKAA